MISFWIDNPEMMPAGVFTTLMYYRFGKPAQQLVVKGEITARPYQGEPRSVLAARARELAARLDVVDLAKVVSSGEDGEK